MRVKQASPTEGKCTSLIFLVLNENTQSIRLAVEHAPCLSSSDIHASWQKVSTLTSRTCGCGRTILMEEKGSAGFVVKDFKFPFKLLLNVVQSLHSMCLRNEHLPKLLIVFILHYREATDQSNAYFNQNSSQSGSFHCQHTASVPLLRLPKEERKTVLQLAKVWGKIWSPPAELCITEVHSKLKSRVRLDRGPECVYLSLTDFGGRESGCLLISCLLF